MGYCPWGRKESDTDEKLSLSLRQNVASRMTPRFFYLGILKDTMIITRKVEGYWEKYMRVFLRNRTNKDR